VVSDGHPRNTTGEIGPSEPHGARVGEAAPEPGSEILVPVVSPRPNFGALKTPADGGRSGGDVGRLSGHGLQALQTRRFGARSDLERDSV
jgi:hypothetical protein